MDPKRLLRSDVTDFERNLLDAVLKERPGPVLEEGMRRALGLPEAAASALAAKTTLLTWGKATMLATVTAGSLAVGTLALKQEQTSPPIMAPQKVQATLAEEPQLAPTPADALPTEDKRPARAAAPGASELREEIRMLDQARAAIRSGAPKRALSLLGSYGERFPKGAFRQEASVLRMEALDKSGDHARAAALANKFLADHPKSPHVERVQRIAK